MRAIGREVDPAWYEIPVFYFTNPAAVHGPADPVRISPGCEAFDYEMELAAVIGAPGRNISVDQAERHIVGYTILCDWRASADELVHLMAALFEGRRDGLGHQVLLGGEVAVEAAVGQSRGGHRLGRTRSDKIGGNTSVLDARRRREPPEASEGFKIVGVAVQGSQKARPRRRSGAEK